MSEEKTNADVAALPFEAAMKELEAIVARLERGDVPLEESIAIYTRGEALKARCTAAGIAREPRGWERPSDHTPVFIEIADA